MSSYFQQWEEIFADPQKSEQNQVMIQLYYALETKAYEQILENHGRVYEGSFNALREELGFEDQSVIFTGFLDGIKPNLKTELDVAAVTDDTEIRLDVDFEKLLLAMHDVKADWLYSLKQWDQVIPEERRQELLYDWRQNKMVRSEKIGRNEPCPCGSGKKYKKCCGK